MKHLLLVAFLYCSFHGYAQSSTDSITNPSLAFDDTTGKALAELATNSQAMKLASKVSEASRYEWKVTGVAWFDNLRASFNLNELNIKASGTEQNVFYPRYNFNLVVPIGMLFTNGKETKKARAQYEGSLAQKNIVLADQKELIEVAYQEYQMQRILLALQETVVQDEAIAFSQIEDKFSKGTVTLEIFSAASKRYNTELSRRITLIRDRNVAKIRLEKLLGMTLEDALKMLKSKPELNKTK